MIINGKEFKEIPGFPGYLASKDGEIYSTKTDVIKTSKKRGCVEYESISINYGERKTFVMTHKLVALAWCPIPEGYTSEQVIGNYLSHNLVVDHIDGNKTNNNADNLRWCTDMENHNFENFTRNTNYLIGNDFAKGGKQSGCKQRYIYVYEGKDYEIKDLVKELNCSKSKITEAFRRNLGLVRQGKLTRRLKNDK